MTAEIDPFEAFMLAVHEHGASGLGYRKALSAYEAAKARPDAMIREMEVLKRTASAGSIYYEAIDHCIEIARKHMVAPAHDAGGGGAEQPDECDAAFNKYWNGLEEISVHPDYASDIWQAAWDAAKATKRV
jgi:hypothetical protein